MPQHTTLIQSDQQVHSVSFFDEEERGLWFPVLKSLIRSGLWRTLSPAAKALLPVMCVDIEPLNPRSPSTLCTASDAELCALAGISRSALFDARRDLANLSLVRKVRTGVWEVFPDRTFARRASGSSSPPGRTKSPESRTPGDCASPATRTFSPATRTFSPATRTPLIREEREEKRCDESARAAVVALLRGEGFGEEEVRELAPLTTASKVRGWILNADHIERHGPVQANGTKWKTSRKAYLVAAIRGDFALYASVQKRLTREEEPELVGIIRAAVGPRITTDPDAEGVAAIEREFPRPIDALRRSGLRASEIRAMGGEELYGELKSRARARRARRETNLGREAE